jgi:hypothetical protein
LKQYQNESGWHPQPLECELPPVESITEDLLPSCVRPLVMDVAERMQTPADYPAVAAVLSLAGVVNRRAVIQAAIAALLTERNLDEAAKSIGIAPNTLLKWMKVPEFDLSYREARRATFRQSVARLQQASSAAVTTLLKVMVDPAAPTSSKVRAASCVLDHCAKSIELEDIEARVAELERTAVAARGNHK